MEYSSDNEDEDIESEDDQDQRNCQQLTRQNQLNVARSLSNDARHLANSLPLFAPRSPPLSPSGQQAAQPMRENDHQQYDHSEAITHRRQTIAMEYNRIATEEPTATLISRLLPSFYSSETIFDACYDELNDFIERWFEKEKSDEITFRLINAQRTLQLIDGDDEIEHHPVSETSDYYYYKYSGYPADMPRIWQLLVLSWRLCEVNKHDFIISYLAETCDTPSGWRQWRKPFLSISALADILSHDELGLALGADQSKGSPFITMLISALDDDSTLPSKNANRAWYHLSKTYFEKRTEQAMSLIDTLFMVMRGHNDNLLDENDDNNPACAEGAYLGLLRCVGEMVTGNQFFLASVMIDECG
jgi:hypothetical protein